MTEYAQIVASDIHRNGLGLELWHGDNQVGEIFRSDQKGELTVTLLKQDVPLAVIEQFIADAKTRLLPFVAD